MPPFRCGLPLFILLLALAAPAQAQPVADTTSGARGAVLAVVEQLFDGMRAGDSTAVRAVFDEGARMQSISQEDGAPLIRTGSVDRFVEAVGRPHDAVWDERIWDPVVQIDGPMAMAWTPYAFYRGDTLSHCGVNAIHFIRRGDAWKVFYLVDTRQQDGCEIPEDVRKDTGDGG
jgi:hypothetical protein